MTFKEAQAEFAVRYYRWAREEFRSEIEQGFPLLNRLITRPSRACLRLMAQLTPENQFKFAAGLVMDTRNKKLYEIKPILSYPLGVAQLAGYIAVFNYFDPQKGWTAGTQFDYRSPDRIYLGLGTWAFVRPPSAGVILYDVVDLPSLGLVTVGVAITADIIATVGVASFNSLMGAP